MLPLSLVSLYSVYRSCDHIVLTSLNLQAHQSAQAHADEYIMEACLTFDKVELLLRELGDLLDDGISHPTIGHPTILPPSSSIIPGAHVASATAVDVA